MPRLALLLPMLVLASGPLARTAAAALDAPPVDAVVESTTATSGDHIRQYLFDGDDATYYLTETAPGREAVVSLVFDEPVQVESIEVRTGSPEGEGEAAAGAALEGSEDGRAFERLADFADGVAGAEPGRKLKAVRVVAAKDADGPLAIREIKVGSEPALSRFAFPVEVVVDELDEADMKDWAEKAAKACERYYGRINEALRSDGYTPARVIKMSLKNGIDVPAYASGNRITGSVSWFKDHPDDVGAMIHEATHVVQRYRSRRNPGWLVEGVADYVRFILYEPKNIGPINPRTARYDQSYRVTARFLDYVGKTYDEDFVLKLNRAMREGTYSDDLFKEWTGKTKEELGEEWQASLSR